MIHSVRNQDCPELPSVMLNLSSGEEYRNRILRAHEEDAEKQGFIEKCRCAFREYLRHGPSDLPTALRQLGISVPTSMHPSCLGAVTGSMARRGEIVRSTGWAKAPQSQAHARANPVWVLVRPACQPNRPNKNEIPSIIPTSQATAQILAECGWKP